MIQSSVFSCRLSDKGQSVFSSSVPTNRQQTNQDPKTENREPITEKGQTLIEVLVAMATAVAVMSAIAITVVTSLSNVEFTKNQNLATQYSREGLEVVRRIAKSNWNNFTALNAMSYCLKKGATTIDPVADRMPPTGCGQNIDIFRRQIDIEQNSTSCDSNTNARITSIVSWSDSKCGAANVFCHEVRLDSCVANINPVGGV